MENKYKMEKINALQTTIDRLLGDKNNIKILEAGCGSISKVEFKKTSYIVGIDISEKQLQRNAIINEKILGDIQYYKFQSSIFDVIICWDVLEHLPKPKLALNNFSKAIKENGIIILALPNILSLKGLMTKFTPHWFHIFIYKHIYGWKNAGQNDIGPFKTYYKFFISPASIKKFAFKNGFITEYLKTSDGLKSDVGETISQKSKLLYFFIEFVKWVLKIISFGKIGDSEYVIILRKQYLS